MIPKLDLITTPGPYCYALVDSGEGRKLERFGDIMLDRPEPQALWRRSLGAQAWAEAHAVFSASSEDDEKGRWRLDRAVPESFELKLDTLPGNESALKARSITMLGKLSGLWHVGLFPEQIGHWNVMLEFLARRSLGNTDAGQAKAGQQRAPARVLNLFAYTGAATLLAAAAQAEVTHVDASKKAVSWARENQAASGLQSAPIRWIVEDARKFVAREVRRDKTYDVILVDPPKFGRGPEGEVWDLFQHLAPLLRDCAKLTPNGQPALVILTSYAVRASALMLHQVLMEAMENRPGRVDSGELALVQAGTSGRLLPTSMYATWISHQGTLAG